MSPKKALITIFILFIAMVGFFGAWYFVLKIQNKPSVVEKQIEPKEAFVVKTKEDQERGMLKLFEELGNIEESGGTKPVDTKDIPQTKAEAEQEVIQVVSGSINFETETGSVASPPLARKPVSQFPVIDEKVKQEEKEILNLINSLEFDPL